MTTRRTFLSSTLAVAGATLIPARLLRAASDLKLTRSPFTLGVASGCPTSDSVVLWTRLAPAPREPGGGMPSEVVPVQWEMGTDDQMKSVVRKGTEYATPDWAHSVHVEPVDLEPGRDYWYRFTAGGFRSPIGHTRTAPALNATPARLRIAVGNCQQYEQGYFTAYRHMLSDDLDFIVHVGDYIYEDSWGHNLVRHHDAPTTFTLDDYRIRHALYRSDPDLQAAHAGVPWLLTWDDHDVANDYAGDVSEFDDDPELFRARRACAYKAYYEHMPLPRQAVPFGPNMRLYMERASGNLATVFLLDQRQYRSPEGCPLPGRRGGHHALDCAELDDPRRTMLGARQEAWLQGRLAASKAQWNILAQGTLMAYVNEAPPPGRQFWTDAWSGYPAARERLIRYLADHQIANPVVLSGDIHSFVVSKLNAKLDDPDSPVVASEFTATSITSEPPPEDMLQKARELNPNVLLATGLHRGYPLLEFTRDHVKADLITVDDVKKPGAGRQVLASYVVEAGKAGPVRA
jgi:alkaline phosphatase D